MTRVSFRDAQKAMEKLEEFQASNLYGRRIQCGKKGLYIVFSYGPHWPLYVCSTKNPGVWIGNRTRTSQTTSRHRNIMYPLGEQVVWRERYYVKAWISAYLKCSIINYPLPEQKEENNDYKRKAAK